MNLDRAPKIIYSRYSEPKLKKALDGILAGLPFSVSREALRQLSSALFEMQRTVLFLGVEADLKMFSDKKILYVKLNRGKEGELQKILDDAAKVEGFDPGPVRGTRGRSHRDAYRYYCDNILSPGKGIYQFLSRNPNAGMLLDRVTANFVGNVRECLTRLREDKYVLERIFLDGGTVKALQAIIHPGSDSHRGGKQVLFLDFAYKGQQGKNREKRIVYKPSDVEIDYRLAGKNTPALKQVLEEKYSDAGFPFPHESLFELLDRKVFKQINEDVVQKSTGGANEKERLREQLLLPTYTILPRNPGSRLKPRAETQLPIETSYGYLEYLEHEPRIPERVGPGVIEDYVRRQRGWKFRDKQHTDADWIIERPEQAFACFRLWGRLMTIACVFLQTDLHFQNQRVRRRKPYLIDLENCLIKACPTPRETLIAGNLDTPICAPDWMFELAEAASSSQMPVEVQPIQREEYRVNQIYLRENQDRRTSVTRVSVNDPPMALNVKQGIEEALRGMTRIREELADWIQAVNLADIVVRHVVRETPNFSAAVQQFIDVSAKADNRARAPAEILADYMGKRRKKAVDTWEQGGRNRNNPFYSLEVPTLNGVDFQNLDVPAYYRRVGSLDLLTSRGEKVTYASQEGDDQSLRFDHYHQAMGLELLTRSLLEKLPKDRAELEHKVEEFTGSVYPGGIPVFDPTERLYQELGKAAGTVLLPSVEEEHGGVAAGVVQGWALPESVPESLATLAGRWPRQRGGRRVAVVLIDMDEGTASEEEAAAVINQQIKVLQAARRSEVDVLEVWIEGQRTATRLQAELDGYARRYRFTKKGTESCFAATSVGKKEYFEAVLNEKNVGLAVVMGHSIDLCVKASIFGRPASPLLDLPYSPGLLDRDVAVLTSQRVLYPGNPSFGGYYFKPMHPPSWVTKKG